MHTVDHVEKARDETKKALKYQSQARKVRFSFCLETRESIFFFCYCAFSLPSFCPFLLPPHPASGEREPWLTVLRTTWTSQWALWSGLWQIPKRLSSIRVKPGGWAPQSLLYLLFLSFVTFMPPSLSPCPSLSYLFQTSTLVFPRDFLPRAPCMDLALTCFCPKNQEHPFRLETCPRSCH